MAVQITHMTNEAFRAYENLPEHAHHSLELLEGIPYHMPSPSPLHQKIVFILSGLLYLYLTQHPLGDAYGDNLDYELAEGIILKPALSFVSKERAPTLPKRYTIAPDLVVEVMSPTNSHAEISKKIETFFRHGTRLAWVIEPEDRLVRVYRPETDGSINVRVLTATDTLEGGEVLPAFGVTVSDLFPTR
ncbi:MAG TPA: Uma2 family endonuclease [Aggregatilineales bacterium]|nr:Uma2 family endonuclease [Anaerolineales bacterium]HRE47651.1 Uma2 family endonuclease [Aggregatilineales bacterium]